MNLFIFKKRTKIEEKKLEELKFKYGIFRGTKIIFSFL
jgi:hypothetical protein